MITVKEFIDFLNTNVNNGRLNMNSEICISDYGDGPDDSACVNGISICSLGLDGEPFVALCTSEF